MLKLSGKQVAGHTVLVIIVLVFGYLLLPPKPESSGADAASGAVRDQTREVAYAISSVPLLVLFIYATKPFIRGVTAGGLKA